MSTLRNLALALVLAGAALPAAALVSPERAGVHAAEVKAFSSAAFEAAKKAGGPILVEITAPWCPTCKAQKPVLSRLASDPRFAKLTVFQVDFDSQKDAVKMLGASMQSTLISYKGSQEVARSTGVTDPRAIESQLAKSI
jgi:thiol-disulfide isomerase/thioredoxin